MTNFYLAQLLALLSSFFLLISFWQKKRKKILFFQMLDSFFGVLQYLLLGAFTGGIINFLGAIRALFFSKSNNKYYLYLFLALYIIASLITFNGIKSLIPLLAALIYTVVIWNKEEKNIRFFSIFVFMLWFIYDFLVKAYVSFTTDIILILSNIFAINRYKMRLKN